MFQGQNQARHSPIYPGYFQYSMLEEQMDVYPDIQVLGDISVLCISNEPMEMSWCFPDR